MPFLSADEVLDASLRASKVACPVPQAPAVCPDVSWQTRKPPKKRFRDTHRFRDYSYSNTLPCQRSSQSALSCLAQEGHRVI